MSPAGGASPGPKNPAVCYIGSVTAASTYPSRIVCLTEETTETLYLLGEDWRIVGISGFTVRPPHARKEKPRNWLFDFGLLMSYWGGEGGRSYHHTAPINALYGLHESLVALFEEWRAFERPPLHILPRVETVFGPVSADCAFASEATATTAIASNAAP